MMIVSKVRVNLTDVSILLNCEQMEELQRKYNEARVEIDIYQLRSVSVYRLTVIICVLL